MATENELNEHYQHAMDTMARAYHAVTRDGSVPAVAREAIKDVRNTIHEVFFGKSERGGEPGAPLNPLFHDIIEARNAHGEELGPSGLGQGPTPGPLLTPGDIAEGRGQGAGHSVYGPEHGVYGPEHGVHGPASAMQASAGGPAGQLPTPGQIANNDGLDSRQAQHGNVHGQGVSGSENAARGSLPTPGQIAGDDALDNRQPQPGNVHGQEVAQVVPGGWVERELEREKAKQDGNAEGGQNELGRQRSLPDEQRENDKSRGR